MRAQYRLHQLLAALTARVTEADLLEADAHLPRDARVLFRRMPRDGQAHALRVLRALKHQGHMHASLLAAALLHDAGKSAAHITPLTRSLFVLLQHVAPAWLERLSPAMSRGWRWPFVVLRDHPRIGAEWAAHAGCDAMTVALIARHQEHVHNVGTSDEDHLLKILQDIDDQN